MPANVVWLTLLETSSGGPPFLALSQEYMHLGAGMRVFKYCGAGKWKIKEQNFPTKSERKLSLTMCGVWLIQ